MANPRESESHLSHGIDKRIRALRQAQVLAVYLMENHAEEIRKRYFGDEGCLKIVQALPSELREKSPGVLLKAVKIAVSVMFSEKDRFELSKKHYTSWVKENKRNGVYKEMADRAKVDRDKTFTPEKLCEMGRSGVSARGLVPWSDNELSWVMSHMEEHRREDGKGYRFRELAESLNTLFHNGEQVRSKNIGNTVRYYIKRNRQGS